MTTTTKTRTRRLVPRFIAIVALACIGVAAIGTSANAKDKQVLTLTCEQGSFDVTIWGNGTWTPARDNNSTLVFHPTAFGERSVTFYPADGSAPDTRTADANEFQAQPANGHATFECSYRFEESDASGRYVHVGSVSGYFSGGSAS